MLSGPTAAISRQRGAHRVLSREGKITRRDGSHPHRTVARGRGIHHRFVRLFYFYKKQQSRQRYRQHCLLSLSLSLLHLLPVCEGRDDLEGLGKLSCCVRLEHLADGSVHLHHLRHDFIVPMFVRSPLDWSLFGCSYSPWVHMIRLLHIPCQHLKKEDQTPRNTTNLHTNKCTPVQNQNPW